MFKQFRKIISMVLCLALILSTFSIIGTQSVYAAFGDTSGHWAESVIDKWSDKGVINGYEDGSFCPDNSITRAEFAKIIVTAKGYTDAASINYIDVRTSDWYYSSLTLAAKAGIINGYEDGSFRPEAQITREEACAIISRAYVLSGSGSLSFTDSSQISEWARTYVSQLSANDIIRGYEDGSFRPQSPITRAETVQILDRVADEPMPTLVPDDSDETSTPTPTSNSFSMFGGGGGGGFGGGTVTTSSYTVTFDLNYEGATGAPAAQRVKKGEKATEPAAPVRNGFVFGGWYKNSDCTEEFEFNTSISSNITLYAKWLSATDETDTDKDGVTDNIETLFGSDLSKDDTDNDGLSDYVEIYQSQTDPLLVDSDGNGINDGDEDLDEDGLTNIKEVELGTSLSKPDTDMDDISDFDEVNEHMTNPCKFDTDDDGLADGDELLFGLDPLVQKTDGVTLDSEREFEQHVSENNISDEVLSSVNDAIPSLSVTTNGNINRSISIDKTVSTDFSDSRAIVGTPIDIHGADLSDATISFKLNNQASVIALSDTNNEYATDLICYYDNEGNTNYLETYYDEATNTISADINSEGTYFILDVQNLFDELGLAMPSVADLSSLTDAKPVSVMTISDFAEADNQNQNNDFNNSSKGITPLPIAEDSNVVIASADAKKVTFTAASGAMAQADIVFIIDTTGSMDDEINNVKNNVNSFVDALKAKGISAGLALVEYRDIEEDGYDSTKIHKNGSSNWFYDMDAYKNKISSSLHADGGGDVPESVVDALETARLLDMRASAGKIFILVTDADYKIENRYGIPSMSAEIELLKNAGVSCSVVSPSSEEETYYHLYNDTNGIWADIYGNFNDELKALADKIGEEIVGDGYWIYLQGPVPVPVRLNAKPEEGSTEDTDEDGIPDVEELESATPTGEINLDEIITKISHGAITGTDYGIVKMYKYKSSPAETDTDFDGIEDINDSLPKDKTFKGIMHYQEDGTNRTCNVDFSMDYRDLIDGNNTIYSKELSTLSILYASDVYDNLYIEFTKGAVGGNDDTTTFGKILGLKDTKYININSNDYSEDKDDITDFFVGHRQINYNGENHEVIVVSVRGTNGTNSEWSSNFDVGADTTEYYNMTGEHPEWKDKNNHKGFDVAANRVKEKLDEYIKNTVDPNAQKSILITGHSRGAAIANILGKQYEDNSSYRSYVYTFATPNSTTASSVNNYKTIFNVVNEDDIIPYLPLAGWGFGNYGQTKSISIEKNYENKWLSAEEGTWEWLIGKDYNNDGGTSRTLNAFSEISNNREDLYKLDSGKDGKIWENNTGHITKKGAEDEMAELKKTLENEKLLRFCNVYVVGGGILWHVEINYCPAYLMQALCNMTTANDVFGDEFDGIIGGIRLAGHYDLKGKYRRAKASFVASSGKAVVGGMTHPHMQPTYYLIAHNNFEKLKK